MGARRTTRGPEPSGARGKSSGPLKGARSDARTAPLVGSTALSRLGPVQPALRIGKAGDPYEREADDVAEQVVSGERRKVQVISPLRRSALPLARQEDEQDVRTLRRQRDDENETRPLQRRQEEEEPQALQREEVDEEEARPLQRKEDEEDAQLLQRVEEDEEGPVQAAATASPIPTASAREAVRRPGPGSPMAPAIRRTLERSLGADLSQVRVHEGGLAQTAAASIRARAFTHRNHIWLGRGESQGDLRLMAHESTHVVQQGAAVQRAPVTPVIRRTGSRVQRGLWGSIKSLAGRVVESVADLAGAAKRKLLGVLGGFARDLPGYPLLTVILGRDPITEEPVARNATNLVRGFLSFIPGGEERFRQLQESGAVQKAFAWISDRVEELDLSWSTIKRLFRQVWDSLSVSDIADPAGAFRKIKRIFGPPLARIVRFARAVGTKVKEFVFEAALRLAGPMAARVMSFVRKAGGALSTIFSDPVSFLRNLLAAVRRGFTQFAENILIHLKKGLLGWLFGALEGAGIELPETFDLKGILSVVLQILGLTYERFRARLVTRIGEDRVQRLEQAVEFVKILVTEGLAGAWRKIVEWLGNLQSMVLGAIRNWVITRIVKSAVTKLVSMFNPVGAIIQAVITIYDVIAFFVERFKQILALATSIADSIANIARGKIGAAANYVEKTMGRTIPVIISFLARLLGLGGISARIKKVIEGIRERMDAVYDRLIDFVIDKGKAVLGFARKGVSRATAAAGRILEWWRVRKTFKTGKESHTLLFKGRGRAARLHVASSVTVLEGYVQKLRDDGVPESKLARIEEQIDAINALKVDEEGETVAMTKERGGKIQGHMSELAALLADAAPSKERPRSKALFTTRNRGGGLVGERVITRPLSLNPGDLSGSQPTQESPLWKAVRRRQGAYVRGHLLNHNLHGPGENRNLTPITRSLNQTMERQGERQAKNAVLDQNAVIRYEVTAAYGRHRERKHIPEEALLPTEIRVAMEQMRPRKGAQDRSQPGSWERGQPEEGPKIPSLDVSHPHELPADTPVGAELHVANLSEDDGDLMAESPDVDAATASKIVALRAEWEDGRTSFARYSDLLEAEGIGQGRVEALRKSKYVKLF